MSVLAAPLVSVIIVNYNAKQLLEDCLKSIYLKTQGVDFEIIVVDNDSSDGSQARIRGAFPEIIFIESKENLGFGRANNLGAARARGRFLLFLNSDTLFENNAIKLFVDFAQSSGDGVGVIGAWLRGRARDYAGSYGIFPSYSRLVWLRIRRGLPIKEKAIREEETRRLRGVDYIIGADMFMRRELFLDIGGFDPRFFLYYEETELQHRISRAGFRNVLIPDPRIIHLEGGSTGMGMKSRIMMETSMYEYFAKIRGCNLSLALFFFLYTLLSVLSIPRFSLQENIGYYRRMKDLACSLLVARLRLGSL